MGHGMKSSDQLPAETLSNWLDHFGPGSPCFCCGVLLRSSPRDFPTGSEDPANLVCPKYGGAIQSGPGLAWGRRFFASSARIPDRLTCC
jgi:hypothetical protein